MMMEVSGVGDSKRLKTQRRRRDYRTKERKKE